MNPPERVAPALTLDAFGTLVRLTFLTSREKISLSSILAYIKLLFPLVVSQAILSVLPLEEAPGGDPSSSQKLQDIVKYICSRGYCAERNGISKNLEEKIKELCFPFLR